MNKVTLWYKFDKKAQEYIYNHSEEGLASTEVPSPKLDENGKPFSSQSSWKSGKWIKKVYRRVGNILVPDRARSG